MDPMLDRPAVSPYYQLNRREGSIGGTNYQLWVQPQLRAMETAATQQRQIHQLQRQVSQARGPAAAGAVTTGHPTFFGNYSHFYGGAPQVGRPATRGR
jgi:hypothetical protein